MKVECPCGEVVIRRADNQIWCSVKCRQRHSLNAQRQYRMLNPLRLRFLRVQARFSQQQQELQERVGQARLEAEYRDSGTPEWRRKLLEIIGVGN